MPEYLQPPLQHPGPDIPPPAPSTIDHQEAINLLLDLELTPRQRALIEFLAARFQHSLSAQEIYEVLKPKAPYNLRDDNNLINLINVQISSCRHALRKLPNRTLAIYNVGYFQRCTLCHRQPINTPIPLLDRYSFASARPKEIGLLYLQLAKAWVVEEKRSQYKDDVRLRTLLSPTELSLAEQLMLAFPDSATHAQLIKAIGTENLRDKISALRNHVQELSDFTIKNFRRSGYVLTPL